MRHSRTKMINTITGITPTSVSTIFTNLSNMSKSLLPTCRLNSPLLQHPPLFCKHSFVCSVSLKHTGGSDVSSNPLQIAFITADLSNFPAPPPSHHAPSPCHRQSTYFIRLYLNQPSPPPFAHHRITTPLPHHPLTFPRFHLSPSPTQASHSAPLPTSVLPVVDYQRWQYRHIASIAFSHLPTVSPTHPSHPQDLIRCNSPLHTPPASYPPSPQPRPVSTSNTPKPATLPAALQPSLSTSSNRTCASCSCFSIGWSSSAFGSPMHFCTAPTSMAASNIPRLSTSYIHSHARTPPSRLPLMTTSMPNPCIQPTNQPSATVPSHLTYTATLSLPPRTPARTSSPSLGTGSGSPSQSPTTSMAFRCR
uniref:Uncharacterized protein n=1 Tax=Physcomitrium patens TaxID=3218 RepID=A0A7I4EAS7_PHYPA